MIDNLSYADQNKIEEAQKTLPAAPVAIVALCRSFGLSATRKDNLEYKFSGFIRKTDENCHIFYNGRHALSRQRFTVAHQLAHCLLHRALLPDEYYDNLMWQGGLAAQDEVDANRLARDILMPQSAVNEYIRTKKEVLLGDLATVFGVSAQAMAIRLGVPLDYPYYTGLGERKAIAH